MPPPSQVGDLAVWYSDDRNRNVKESELAVDKGPDGAGRQPVSRCQRTIVSGGDQQPQPVAADVRYHAMQSCEQCPVRPIQIRAARPLPLQYGELVAQEQDPCGLPILLMSRQP